MHRRFYESLEYAMTMSRAQLGRMIDSGRGSRLKDIRSEADADSGNPEKPRLFTTSFLNKCIFLKTVEAESVENSVHYNVRNMLYFPYNNENHYEGGDSVFLSDPKLNSKLSSKFGSVRNSADGRAIDEGDDDLIRLLETIPTFDPFLLKCKVQQLGLEDKVDPIFFNVDEREWNVLQANIRGKIRALVERAFSGSDNIENSTIDRQVTIFLNKIWEARDIDGIEDLVSSLGIPHDKAPELFFAWKAICYYQTKYELLKASLKDFFGWFGGGTTALPGDFATLAKTEQESVLRTKRVLRQRMRENFRSIDEILADYEAGYRKFIENGNPEDFKKFLSNADVLCDNLAGRLSAFAHAINITNNVTAKWGRRLAQTRHAEVLDSLTNIFGSESAASARPANTGMQNHRSAGDGMVGIVSDPAAF